MSLTNIYYFYRVMSHHTIFWHSKKPFFVIVQKFIILKNTQFFIGIWVTIPFLTSFLLSYEKNHNFSLGCESSSDFFDPLKKRTIIFIIRQKVFIFIIIIIWQKILVFHCVTSHCPIFRPSSNFFDLFKKGRSFYHLTNIYNF